MENTLDPNVGTRNWTKLVQIANNKVSEITTSPLLWKTSTGERPTDQWLVAEGYRGYVDNGEPSYNKYEQKVIKTPLDQLTIGANNVVVQTYTVTTLSSSEKLEAETMLREEINKERERRINVGCIVNIANVGNVAVRGTNEDMRNLTNLGQLANMYILTGKNDIIQFRDDTNQTLNLLPAQMSEVWQKAVGYVSSLYQASWMMKDQIPIPQDYTLNKHWPSRSI